jgi:hypothetical protein
VRFEPPGVKWSEYRRNIFKTEFNLLEVMIYS